MYGSVCYIPYGLQSCPSQSGWGKKKQIWPKRITDHVSHKQAVSSALSWLMLILDRYIYALDRCYCALRTERKFWFMSNVETADTHILRFCGYVQHLKIQSLRHIILHLLKPELHRRCVWKCFHPIGLPQRCPRQSGAWDQLGIVPSHKRCALGREKKGETIWPMVINL